MNNELKTYYVTFGLDTFLRGRYQAIRAHNREVVVAYMDKHYPKLWASIFTEPVVPSAKSTALTQPFELHYRRAEDV